ncbi:MAG: ABC transporter permease [Candidatus Ancillula sp.]|jgi:ABC-2 type transport system permease protein|nr:ABC transporter permease [Candidatus Ancillula sp.]
MLNLIKSEWDKVASLKSTWVISILSLVMVAGGGTAFCAYMNNRYATSETFKKMLEREGRTPQIWDYSGIFSSLMIICLVIFAILMVTNEYTFKTINTTLLANPNRVKVFSAKAIVVIVYSGIVSLVSLLVSFFLCYAVTPNFHVAFGDEFSHKILIHLGCTVLAIILLSLMCFAIGFLVKNSAAAIAIFVVFYEVLTGIIQMITAVVGKAWIAILNNCLPGSLANSFMYSGVKGANNSILSDGSVVKAFTHVQSFLGLVIWLLILVIPALICFKKRDA